MSRTSVALKKHQSPQLVPSAGCPLFPVLLLSSSSILFLLLLNVFVQMWNMDEGNDVYGLLLWESADLLVHI